MGNESSNNTPGPTHPRLPVADQPAAPAVMRELRRFHLGDAPGVPLPDGALPVLLSRFRDPQRVRHDFPLVLDQELTCHPLTQLLLELAPAEDRVLRDNLPRLEQHTRALLTDDGAPSEPAGLVRQAGEQMLRELDLAGGSAETAASSLQELVQAVPAGRLLQLATDTPLDLLRAAAERRLQLARGNFGARVEQLAGGVRDQLQVEAGKDPAARQPQALQKTLGAAAGQFLDPAALARAVGTHRGSSPVDPTRRQRLQGALTAFEEYLQHDTPDPIAQVQDDSDPCAAAAACFDREADRLLNVVRAVRVAELELRSAYEPERHDPLLADMDWRGCSAEELHLLPAVVVVVKAETLAESGLLSLSRLLLSGRPVQVLVLQSPARDPAAGVAGDPFAAFRMELAYLAVAHREAFVQQSTAARPRHLLDGFRRALAGTRAALHVVDTGLDVAGSTPPLGSFTHTGAAIEGRAHPLFHYDPEAGETWARRFDFDHNPQPDADWPQAELNFAAATGEDDDTTLQLTFTFADYALLEPAYADQFSLLPDELGGEDIVPLAEHLELDPENAGRRVPFVWVADAEHRLHRVLVRRSLLLACRDRLRFWNTLQELAGVRNEYVREAVQRARQEADEQAQRERAAMQAQHEEELEQVRREATGNAMQSLARMLLELDPLATGPAAPAVPVPTMVPQPEAKPEPVDETAPAAEPEVEEAESEEDDADFDDAWIETARCTSCNDCLDINPLLFVYDANKQARIGDLGKGTFAQLVQAAEKCPARCIHPGKPQNPDEPNLTELVARAEPFQ